jgi:hypothetical protein
MAVDATVVSPIRHLGHSVSSVVDNCWIYFAVDVARLAVSQFHERSFTGGLASPPSSSNCPSTSLVISSSSMLTVSTCPVLHLVMSVGVVVAVDRE